MLFNELALFPPPGVFFDLMLLGRPYVFWPFLMFLGRPDFLFGHPDVFGLT